ncbi:MAG: hypothetical protein LQ351_001018 [Letrouitia transgressa]|nr:MAG: hypothetical protein LQ351_001018 [Letrouitia transgressa]
MSQYTYTYIKGHEPAKAIWPPVTKKCMAIGYVNALDEPRFSRDIGRSFILGGRIYYIYGDTFRNDAGLVSNTYQLVKDRTRPTDAIYLSVDENGLVKPLLELTQEEEALEKNDDIRTALWCFGGVVEIFNGTGLTYYQKHQFDNKNDTSKLQGVGLAVITANEHTGELTANRRGAALLFDSSEPLMGSFSATKEGGWVYVWGQRDNKVYLGRVPEMQCHIKGSYTFWNGASYTTEWQQAVPVMEDMQQGQIVRSSLFGNQYPWIFVGVTRWADNNVMMGVSPTLEGPWDFHPVGQAHGFVGEASYKYCMYPHLWGSVESEGKLLVTWCDAWPGGVIAAEVDIAISI